MQRGLVDPPATLTGSQESVPTVKAPLRFGILTGKSGLTSTPEK